MENFQIYLWIFYRDEWLMSGSPVITTWWTLSCRGSISNSNAFQQWVHEYLLHCQVLFPIQYLFLPALLKIGILVKFDLSHVRINISPSVPAPATHKTGIEAKDFLLPFWFLDPRKGHLCWSRKIQRPASGAHCYWWLFKFLDMICTGRLTARCSILPIFSEFLSVSCLNLTNYLPPEKRNFCRP